MESKTIIITGPTSGIGKVTAQEIAKMGHNVILACRNEEKGKKLKEELQSVKDNSNIGLYLLDLGSLTSIKAMAKNFLSEHSELDVLINNAGTFQYKRRLSVDGFELTFAVNYLGPFLLTNLLLPILKQSPSGRIVNVASGLHKTATLDLSDLQTEKRKYQGMSVYGSSKLANVLFTYTLHDHLREEGNTTLSVNAVHPGFIRTNLNREGGSFFHRYIFHYLLRPFITKSPEVGAQTSIYVATSPEVEGISGKYFAKSQITPSSELSHDKTLQKKLWNISCELTNI
ncbi:SDR family oxidoreductase [Candidatus Hodarchaeum mangrovi]